MPRSILVGLDGSPFSEAAVELGIRWATRFDCLLAAIGVVDEPTITGPQSVPVGGGAFKREMDETRVADARHKVEKLLSQFALRCSEAKVACKLLEEVGQPSEQILRDLQRFDLVLMGRETYFHFETQETSGETLKQVLKNAPRPVVAVPETLTAGDGVLIAYDASIQAARALQGFVATGLAALGPITVLSVDPNSAVDAAKRADLAIEFLKSHDIEATPQTVVSNEQVSSAILAEAHQRSAELVVVGAYGQSRLRDFFLGSVTQRLLKKAEVPLFLFH